MRKKTARREILMTLKNNPTGLTASEILSKMDIKKTRGVRNARHISMLVKGLKGVRCEKGNGFINGRTVEGGYDYKVNLYFYNDEDGALI